MVGGVAFAVWRSHKREELPQKAKRLRIAMRRAGGRSQEGGERRRPGLGEDHRRGGNHHRGEPDQEADRQGVELDAAGEAVGGRRAPGVRLAGVAVSCWTTMASAGKRRREAPATTSLKITVQTKAAIAAAANEAGMTPHGYLISVIDEAPERAGRRREFIAGRGAASRLMSAPRWEFPRKRSTSTCAPALRVRTRGGQSR